MGQTLSLRNDLFFQLFLASQISSDSSSAQFLMIFGQGTVPALLKLIQEFANAVVTDISADNNNSNNGSSTARNLIQELLALRIHSPKRPRGRMQRKIFELFHFADRKADFTRAYVRKVL